MRPIFPILIFAPLALMTLEAKAPDGCFEDWSAKMGLYKREASRVMMIDVDGDSRPDIVLNACELYHSEQGKKLTRLEVSDKFTPKGVRAPGCCQFADINNDGFLDIAFGISTDVHAKDFKDDGRRNEIWLNDGKGGFHKVKDPGLGNDPTTTMSLCFLDYDRDGKIDLFVSNFYVKPWQDLAAMQSRLYRGQGDGKFTDVTEKAGMLGVPEVGKRNSRRPVMGVTHTDWNNDGFQDILVAVYGRQWNYLWKNNGNGTFTDVAAETTFDGDDDRSGKYSDEAKEYLKERRNVTLQDEKEFRANGNTFDIAVADFDNDGNMDCFLGEIVHWWAGPSSDRSMLLHNLGPKKQYRFQRDPKRIPRPVPKEPPHWNEGDIHVGWLDVDNDGLLDLVIASSDYPDEQYLKLYHQKPDHSFEDWTHRLGFRWVSASQISFGDFDRDGATDILVGRNHMRLTEEQKKKYPLQVGLFRNTVAGKLGNGFVNLRLRGQTIGSRVIVTTGDHRQIREVQGGQGTGGHRDDTDCRFGLGKAKIIDTIEVRWPDGKTVQRFEKVDPNKFYTLEKAKKLEEVKN